MNGLYGLEYSKTQKQFHLDTLKRLHTHHFLRMDDDGLDDYVLINLGSLEEMMDFRQALSTGNLGDKGIVNTDTEDKLLMPQ
jgi:hypothetical protein